MPDRLTFAEINLQNYADNLALIREQLSSDTKIMAIIKANAYGHGIEDIADAAVKSGAEYLGVVSLGELKRIRKAGISAPVLILNFIDHHSLDEVLDYDGTITIFSHDLVPLAQKAAEQKGTKLKVHLKVDTGLHRAGCEPSDVLALASAIAQSSHLELEGMFTHLAESESPDASFTQQQLDVFKTCVETLKEADINPPLLHCCNSAAVFAFPDAHYNMVRPGLATYGLNPFPKDHAKYNEVQQNLKPILTLKTSVVFTRDLNVGESVGYNRRWRAERPSKVALLPVGYGDGWRRTPKNAGKVLVRGQFAPIIGSVAMDQIIIDITDIADVAVGDEVVLLGTQGVNILSADDIAQAYETINYEVVTALSDRISRTYTKT